MQQLKISARWKIHEGKFEEFRSIAKECLATVMLKSPNRRHYDWYFNDELRECIVLEKYADSDALLSHISVIGVTEKNEAIKKLHEIAVRNEENFTPNSGFEALIQKERDESWKHGGKTVFGDAKPPKPHSNQLKLF